MSETPIPDNDDDRSDLDRYRAPALEKGLDILELLATCRDGLTQSEIARELSRSVSQIFRMLTCLVSRGYLAVERPSGRYRLTMKLFELAHAHPPMERLISAALPLMKAFAEDVEQSCHLAVINAGRATVIANVDSPGEVGFAVRVGSQWGLLNAASGRVLCAFQAPEERARLLSEPRDATGEPDVEAVNQQLDAIRVRGYEDLASASTRGMRVISAPVLDHRGAAIAAMTVPFIERIDGRGGSFDETRDALSHAAAELSRALGRSTYVDSGE